MRKLTALLLLVFANASTADDFGLPDGDIIRFTTGLNVNADGAPGAYTPGDHGYVYVANGVSLIQDDETLSCGGERSRECRRLWKEAEDKDFGLGTREFCAFGLEVSRFDEDTPLHNCKAGDTRKTIGNAKGRPAIGERLPLATGGETLTYVSTTSIRHLVNGQPRYLDATTVPALVTPKDRSDLLGSVAWVRYGSNEAYAILGDIGPDYTAIGEGGPGISEATMALHQLLRYGTILAPQPLGPIEQSDRCGSEELGLIAPYGSYPDYENDSCNLAGEKQGNTDIRARTTIPKGVEIFILQNVKLPMRNRTIQTEVTLEALEKAALVAGFQPP